MASFDIKNLYTNIPTKETLEMIKTHLNENKFEKEYTIQLIKIIETIITSNSTTNYMNKKKGYLRNHVRNLFKEHGERTFPQDHKKI